MAVARPRGTGLRSRRAQPKNAAEGRCRLDLDLALEDEPGTEATDFGEALGVGKAAGQGRLGGGLDLDAGGDILFHGVVS
ncbi:MAG: hypothetical protein ACLQHS_03825 [Candidatus Limnocylindrales bacterium]